MSASSRSRTIDALLLLMAVIWGTNYSIVKAAFRELDPQAFNALRMTIASGVFLSTIVIGRAAAVRGEPGDTRSSHDLASILRTPARITRQDWLALLGLGVVGHGMYQYCFIAGLARTSVANSSLIIAATPILVAIFTAVLGHDRVSRLHWLGIAMSVAGIYLVVGRGFSVASHALIGDLLMLVAVCCWAIYTLGARPLMRRHSPVGVTGLSMAIGTLLYVPVVWPELSAVKWPAVSAATWAALVYSALFALCVSYTIWYAAVRQIGSARTSVYSNVVPIIAMLTAVIFLGESLGAVKVAGAVAVLAGVALTRVGGE